MWIANTVNIPDMPVDIKSIIKEAEHYQYDVYYSEGMSGNYFQKVIHN